LLKIAPDLTQSQLDDILQIAADTNLSGLIATNTTISREGLATPQSRIDSIGMGGLSGRPVENRSTEVIEYLVKESNDQLPIIGVGGIFTADDAKRKLDAGAKLVQVYTGFVYEGPGMIKRINKQLVKSW
jgi:dihydroorotate dehydrogenase